MQPIRKRLDEESLARSLSLADVPRVDIICCLAKPVGLRATKKGHYLLSEFCKHGSYLAVIDCLLRDV